VIVSFGFGHIREPYVKRILIAAVPIVIAAAVVWGALQFDFMETLRRMHGHR